MPELSAAAGLLAAAEAYVQRSSAFEIGGRMLELRKLHIGLPDAGQADGQPSAALLPGIMALANYLAAVSADPCLPPDQPQLLAVGCGLHARANYAWLLQTALVARPG